ncbi:MAG: signal peptidase I [Ignavibacteriae bacterium]|nr:MAG: signal peptidase I [Ignavibacteriota bacterium]
MEDTGLLAALGIGYILFMLLIYLFAGFCIGKMFEKAGKPLWAGFVPIYNYIVMLEIVGRPTWWIILLLIPPVNIVVGIILAIDIAKSYGKDTLWGILLILFSVVVLPIMAFSSDIRYVGPAAAGEGNRPAM